AKKEEPVAKTAPPTKKEEPEKVAQLTKDLETQLKEKEKQLEEIKRKQAEAEQKSSNVIGEKIVFLQVVSYESDGHYTNDLWVLDPDKDESLYKSPFENICGREFLDLPTGILVIGFEGREKDLRLHHLILLDKENDMSLEIKKIGKENIYWQSQLVYHDKKIYAFEIYEGKVHLSRFNENLEFEARSSEPVNMNSHITFKRDKVYLTSKLQNENATKITILNKEDLKVIKTFKPEKKKKEKK
ncbi:MAG: hypothetical protein N3A69_07175, partial [Leptospiraceae bacterium]|nr:hypothetical protein [Leptospiraceae bacterium]